MTNYFQTEEGKIIGFVIHETNSQIGYIGSVAHILKKYLEYANFPQDTPDQIKTLEIINGFIENHKRFSDRVKESVDKLYEYSKSKQEQI